MKRLNKMILVALLVTGFALGCEQNDINDLQIQLPDIQDVEATGGPAGGDWDDSDPPES